MMRNREDCMARNVCPARQLDQRTRGGWTLIEMLITLTVMGSVTGIAVKTLGSMLRSERNGIEHVARLATISRLARQFRSDIHAAGTIEINSSEPTRPLLLITVKDSHQIQYAIESFGLLRTERRPNQSPKSEPWRLNHTRFECVESTGPPRILTLVVATLDASPTPGTTPAAALKELRIVAVIGRDRDYSLRGHD